MSLSFLTDIVYYFFTDILTPSLSLCVYVSVMLCRYVICTNLSHNLLRFCSFYLVYVLIYSFSLIIQILNIIEAR